MTITLRGRGFNYVMNDMFTEMIHKHNDLKDQLVGEVKLRQFSSNYGRGHSYTLRLLNYCSNWKQKLFARVGDVASREQRAASGVSAPKAQT
jgi:hypothetical protein